MGDRANIVIKQDGSDDRVYFYTHWHGTELPEMLHAALKRGEERWSDNPYLARVIFCEMTKGNPMALTGFGISTSLCDNEYPIIVVDTATETVSFEPEPDHAADRPIYARKFTFKEFVGLTDLSWDALDKAQAA
jgi:hypothetical protein